MNEQIPDPAQDQIQGAFRALADPTRRQILMHLGERDLTIGEVSERFDMTRAAVKKHLTILEEGQLISVRAVGRERFNRLEPKGLKSANEWLTYFDQFWDDKLANLAQAINDERQDNSND